MTRIIVVVKGGLVTEVYSSDPDTQISVLDYDDWNDDEENPTFQELKDEADKMKAVY